MERRGVRFLQPVSPISFTTANQDRVTDPARPVTAPVTAVLDANGVTHWEDDVAGVKKTFRLHPSGPVHCNALVRTSSVASSIFPECPQWCLKRTSTHAHTHTQER